MSKILSIGTALPAFRHNQMDILQFMQTVYAGTETDKRKLKFLYSQSGIEQRYSVIPDYSKPASEWKFYPGSEGLEPFPSLEQRMNFFNRYAPQLSVDAARNCVGHNFDFDSITHLITVSCTGMSAPGLDIQVMELLDLRKDIWRTSVNFMGCYAAIHALKMADAFCKSSPKAKVLVICTELCTLHFQREQTMDNISSSLLFGDGSAAVLMSGAEDAGPGIQLDHFYSEIIPKGKRDMAWELSSTGFLMTLSNYISDLIEEDFDGVVDRACKSAGLNRDLIGSWCIHPGGKRILEAISRGISLAPEALKRSAQVLKQFGNMSSATILFVLKEFLAEKEKGKNIFGSAFGPGLTAETFIAHYE